MHDFPIDAAPTLEELGEHLVIQEIVAAAPSAINGDDAAVMYPAEPNTRTVATTDTLVEGRHFRREWSTPREVGHKAIVQNFADVEAMGARPLAALLSFAAPGDTPVGYVKEIASGIAERCKLYSAQLVGGDLTRADQLILTVTALGSLGGSRKPLTLDAARVGQRIVAHGKIGYSAAGLALLQHYGRAHVPERFEPLVSAHVTPHLEPGRGIVARATGATSMTDNSDGLVVDVGAIARRSGVGIDLEAEAIAPDELLLAAGEAVNQDPWEWVLSGGEDHTLIAATDKDAASGFRPIGRVVKGAGVTVDGAKPRYNTGWTSY
ncbi:thiamine-phosphate kinase [Corynebacterium incognita]|uniref:thiamine-phosphate kinase n=1 Tax=Corynebacterium incognita TaxID=2754725 RepID=UPI001FE7ADA1|nr:thiamine-phosphate kinase [Corynebacterium incognita]